MPLGGAGGEHEDREGDYHEQTFHLFGKASKVDTSSDDKLILRQR